MPVSEAVQFQFDSAGDLIAGVSESRLDSPPPLPDGDLNATWAEAKATFMNGLDSEGALERILDSAVRQRRGWGRPGATEVRRARSLS